MVSNVNRNYEIDCAVEWWSSYKCVCCVWVCRCPLAVSGLRGVIHHAAGGWLQSNVLGALSLQQRDRWLEAERLRCRLHGAVR